tara:strand:- start:10392 stop:11318 length:927 start_codon:yes stop_codon:yes gene_type:complete
MEPSNNNFSPYIMIATIAMLGVLLGASGEAGDLSSELFLASSILLGIVVIAVVLASQLKSTKNSGSNDSAKLDAILEAVQMSENAKRVLFRDRELSVLRSTVQADIAKGEFHSSLVLCDQMATVFGAVEEAEGLRAKVQSIIHEHHDARIRDEIEKLQVLLGQHKWVDAYQYAAKLRRLFPDSPRLHSVEQHIADARIQYRHELEAKFLQAAEMENVERSMKLLRELDGYLTPDEARRFRDTATEVITKYRDSLGARFKMAVSDHRWHEAIEFGEVIMHQFPNTKMAEEVKTMLETIRVRITEDETLS